MIAAGSIGVLGCLAIGAQAQSIYGKMSGARMSHQQTRDKMEKLSAEEKAAMFAA